VTGAPDPDSARAQAALAAAGTVRATNPEDLLDTLLDCATKLQTALLTHDVEQVELLSLHGERLAASLLAVARSDAGRPRMTAASGLLERLSSLHKTNAAIVRSRVVYLSALWALLNRSATYDTNGTAPPTARSTIILKA